MKKIIFIPTWRCNLKCSYCDYSVLEEKGEGYSYLAFTRMHHVKRELKWFEWIGYLERFEPYLLELTGGEPLMYKNLDKLLWHLGPECRWAITSNTLIRDLIKKVPAFNCISWTASYHYHSDDVFFENLFILKRKGFIVRVTIVVTPENYKIAVEKIKKIADEGYGVNIHPVLKQSFSWQEHKDIWDELKTMADGKRIVFIDDIPDRWLPERYDYCEAGRDYFALMPDGQVLRCYSQILTPYTLGWIGDFEPFKTVQPCNMDCMFPCDRRVKKFNVKLEKVEV